MSKKTVLLQMALIAFVLFALYQITKTEHYYVVYNTYVRNNSGEMVEQDENKHLSVEASSLDDAKDAIFEIENQLYEDVVVDSVSIQSHVIVKQY